MLGFGDPAWVRTDVLRRLAGPAATPEWEQGFAALLDYARTRGWVDDAQGRDPRPRGAPRVEPGHRRERRPGVSGELRDAVLLSFDNLGEAADLERGTAQRPIGDDPSVTVGLPRALDALAAHDLRATFFVEGLNAELYPQALRDIAAAGHEVGLHGWRHEVWDVLSERGGRAAGPGVAALSALGLEVEGFRRRAARWGAARSRRWPPTACAGARRPATTRATGARSCRLPFRWPAVDAYHRLESFADRRTSWGDRTDVASPREAADALIGALDARGDGPLVLILHPFLLLEEAEAAQARRVLEHVAEQVARGDVGWRRARARGAGGRRAALRLTLARALAAPRGLVARACGAGDAKQHH